jgi:hypothetical protein
MASWTATRALAAQAALTLTLTAMNSFAQPTQLDRTLAQSLFEEAHTAMDAGRLAEACDKFARSQALDPAGGTILNLAVCHEKMGRLATAWAEFNEAYSAAVRDNRKERAAFARERSDALRAKLPRIVVTIDPNETPLIEVRLDGVILPAAALGVAAPVDPGEHTIDARAPGLAPVTTRIAAVEAQIKTIAIPRLSPPMAVMPAPTYGPTPMFTCPQGQALRDGRCIDEGTPPPSPSRGAHFSGASWALLSVGVASLGVSGVTGVLALSAKGDAKEACTIDRGYCADQTGLDAGSRARTLAWVSTITLGVGVAGVITSFLLPRSQRPASPERAAVLIGPTSVGARVQF